MDDDHYATLGLAKFSSVAEVRRAYKTLALQLHPDKNPHGEHRFKKVSTSYNVLNDDATREQYNHSLRQAMSQSMHAAGRSAYTSTFRPRTAGSSRGGFSFFPAGDSHDSIRRDRDHVRTANGFGGGVRKENVSAYAPAPSDQERMDTMRRKHEAAERTDFSKWFEMKKELMKRSANKEPKDAGVVRDEVLSNLRQQREELERTPRPTGAKAFGGRPQSAPVRKAPVPVPTAHDDEKAHEPAQACASGVPIFEAGSTHATLSSPAPSPRPEGETAPGLGSDTGLNISGIDLDIGSPHSPSKASEPSPKASSSPGAATHRPPPYPQSPPKPPMPPKPPRGPPPDPTPPEPAPATDTPPAAPPTDKAQKLRPASAGSRPFPNAPTFSTKELLNAYNKEHAARQQKEQREAQGHGDGPRGVRYVPSDDDIGTMSEENLVALQVALDHKSALVRRALLMRSLGVGDETNRTAQSGSFY